MKNLRRTPSKRFRTAAACFAALTFSTTIVTAHNPDRETREPHPRIDVIGPLGNNLPASYRRRMNRPTYLGGKIAYWISPTSQEAIAWHRAQHAGAYKNHAPRIENVYFYPKPWEALAVGPRVSVEDQREIGSGTRAEPLNRQNASPLAEPGPMVDEPESVEPASVEPVPLEPESQSDTTLEESSFMPPVYSTPFIVRPASSTTRTPGNTGLQLFNAEDERFLEGHVGEN